YIRQAEDISRRLGDPRTIAHVAMASGVYRFGVGDWPAIFDRCDEGVRLSEQVGDGRLCGQCLSILGNSAVVRGEFLRARPMLEALVQQGERNRDAQLQAWGLLALAESALPQGHVDEALG